jgi:TM2 domain-containing membrane protein YozV
MSATCPYCRTPFEENDEIAACAGCATQHHAECLQENGGCTVFGCSQAPLEEPKISVSNQDFAPLGRQQPAPQNVPSFLNLSGPMAPLQLGETPEVALPPPSSPVSLPMTPTPPPPRVPGAPPPQSPGVMHSNHVPVVTYPTFGGYAAPPPEIHSYTSRKSRVVFVLLAVFLGAFGGHNFYAGYVKKGVIQLCVTLFSCFFGSLISWIWAIVEACMVDCDNDGTAFV